MITEDYCSFELSKLLKEKGFDWMCNSYYTNTGMVFNHFCCHYFADDEHDKVDILTQTLRPTHQMAMKWLREKWIFIEISFSVTINGEPCYNFGILSRSAQWVYRHKQSFSNYEEAVDAALKYSLENLI